MSLGHGTKIVRDGLVFYYDMDNDKSWKGAPTTNIIHWQNAVAQPTYTPYVWNAGGTWQEKHPDAITAVNASGSSITGYVNSGVGDATNKYHGIWTYDDILRKPVVTMRDFDASWKAKSFGTGKTFTQLGLGYGDTYTISWLQWVDNLSKKLRVGVYGRNTSGTNNFHDGLKGVPNTQAGKWERVYTTYTISTAWNLNTSLSIYMYGHYDARATIKIADVQWEVGSIPSKFSPNETRVGSESIRDISGNNNNLSNNGLTYNSDYTFEFDGTDDFLFTSDDVLYTRSEGHTTEGWFKFPSNTNTSWHGLWGRGLGDGGYMFFHSGGKLSWYSSYTTGSNLYYDGSIVLGTDIALDDTTWYQIVVAYNPDTETHDLYLNGELKSNRNISSILDIYNYSGGISYIGSGPGRYGMHTMGVFRHYNRTLTTEEIKQNFEATRGRYGI